MKGLLIVLAALAAVLFLLFFFGLTLGLWGGEVVCESNGVEVPCDEAQDKATPVAVDGDGGFPTEGHVMEAGLTVLWLLAYGLTAAAGVWMVIRLKDKQWQVIGTSLFAVYTALFLSVPMFLFFTQVSSPGDEGPDPTCDRFPTQYVAQLFFEEFSDNEQQDVSGLDPDGNGIACEDGPFLSTSRYESRFGNIYYVYEQAE